ncbi:MAG: response regulator transcription factor [Ardenticatenaceae bacterium]|nr:response regulator transcription factor [Ardenticatenaceae bacterium]
MGHILLVADRKTTIDSLTEILGKHEYELTVASSQRRALRMMRHVGPDLTIVDMTSAKLSGGKVCLALRRVTEAPILALVREAPTDSNAPVSADAWLVKPFSTQSLVAQVQQLLLQPQVLVLGAIVLDLRTREVRVGDREPVRLTPKQFALLRCFMMQPGEVWTRARLMQEVWQTNFLDDTRTLDVHIRWLREKIESNPSSPTYIQTIRGVGYRFVLPEHGS